MLVDDVLDESLVEPLDVEELEPESDVEELESLAELDVDDPPRLSVL